MNTVLNVKKVSLLLFLVLMGTHLASTLLLARGATTPTLTLLSETLDIPALIAGLLYGFTSAKLYLEETGRSTHLFDPIAGALAGLILIGAIYLNFIFNRIG